MKKLIVVGTVALLCATIGGGTPVIAEKDAGNDAFVGRYQCWGSLSDKTPSAHGVVAIAAAGGDSFMLTGLKAYEKQKFIRKSASTLCAH
jgi:hypothetical protein